MSMEEVKRAINEVLDEREGYASNTHIDHHHFVEEMIDERRRKKERHERLKQQVVGWGIITMLSGIGYGSYHLLIELIKKVSH